MTVLTIAMVKEFCRALVRFGIANRSRYHRRVKPCQR
jgi:hypothetical protein